MGKTESGGRGWARMGCIGAAAVALLGLIVALALSGIAAMQNRRGAVDTAHLEQPVPGTAAASPDGASEAAAAIARGRVILDIAVGQVTVVPGPTGSPIRVDGAYELGRFELSNSTTEDPGGGWTTRITLRPLGSEAWALFRLKVGGTPPRLRVTLPRGVPIALEGSVRKAIAAMELGGLWVESTDLEVRGGSVELSFLEPTQAPMRHLNVKVSGGAMGIGSMGNASPASSTLIQRFGALDLDLRGAWQGDADVFIESKTAGGTLWLPTNMRIEGVERPALRPGPAHEIEPLTLRLEIEARKNQVVLID